MGRGVVPASPPKKALARLSYLFALGTHIPTSWKMYGFSHVDRSFMACNPRIETVDLEAVIDAPRAQCRSMPVRLRAQARPLPLMKVHIRPKFYIDLFGASSDISQSRRKQKRQGLQTLCFQCRTSIVCLRFRTSGMGGLYRFHRTSIKGRASGYRRKCQLKTTR